MDRTHVEPLVWHPPLHAQQTFVVGQPARRQRGGCIPEHLYSLGLLLFYADLTRSDNARSHYQMKTRLRAKCWLLAGLFVFFGASAEAGTNFIEDAVLRFPSITAWDYRPDVAAQAANTLIGVGEHEACATLIRLAAPGQHAHGATRVNEKIAHLCRLLFTPKLTNGFLRPPQFGASAVMPYESLKSPAWPDLPFVIVNEVPLSMNLGYGLVGGSESATNYLAYCRANGAFRTNTFRVATRIAASNALGEVFASAAWKALKWTDTGLGWSYVLDENYAKLGLWQQVENIK
jgi:hypothetical protein